MMSALSSTAQKGSGIKPLLKLPLFIGLPTKDENDTLGVKGKCTAKA